MLTRLRNKLRYLLTGREIDRDLARELEFHRDMLTRDQEQLGYSHETAMLNARRKMGNTPLMLEYSRDAWIITWFDTLARDVRYAIRSFARNPAFTLVALLTLALGIGANTAIFRLVDAVLLRALPVERPEELFALRGNYSYWRFEQVRDRNQIFTDTIGTRIVPDVTISMGDQPLGTGTAELVSGNYFPVLGVQPVLGRPITPDDDRAAGAGPVAVISHAFWTRAFAAAPDVLGRTIRLKGGQAGGGTSGFEPENPNAPKVDEAALTIIGVAPPEFFGDTVGRIVDVWLPITMQPYLMPGRMWLTRRTASWVNILGRAGPGMTEQQASEAITVLMRQIRAEEIGSTITEQQKRNIANARVTVDAASKGFGGLRRQFSQPLLVLMTVVTLVLLIACLNVANLLLARATARQQEIAMRLSLGASRWRLIRQLLTESLLLAGTGGVLGLVLATAGAKVLVTLVSGDARGIVLRLDPDWRIVIFTIGVSLVSGTIFGLIPALRGTRNLQQGLRDTTRTTAGGRKRMAKVLVGAQVAVSLVLLVACGLFLRTLFNLKGSALGYDTTGLIQARVDPVAAGYKGEELGQAIVELTRRVAALPGVRSAAFSENGLFGGVESGTAIDIEGYKPASDQDSSVAFDQAGPGFFANAGIPVVVGREFTERDGPGAPRVTVINHTMAQFYFPNQNPVGKRIHVRGPTECWVEVIGVARDAQDHDLRAQPVRRLYVSYLQPIDGIVAANLQVRAASAASAPALLAPIRAEIERFNTRMPILSLKMTRMQVEDSIVAERLIAKLSTFFAALAALLAAIGLYGVMSYTVARRTSEIGVRMALGAPRGAVAAMILREIVMLVALGSIVGAAAAIGLSRFVRTLIWGLEPHDPATVAAAIGVFLLIGLAAGYVPARRATRIDPVVALRAE